MTAASTNPAVQRDQVTRLIRDVDQLKNGDHTLDGERRLLLGSPDGELWQLRVANNGTLSTVRVSDGTIVP